MSRPPRPRPSRRAWLVAGATALVALLVLPWLVAPIVSGRLRAAAAARGMDARWDALTFRWPLGVEVRGLEVDRREPPEPVLRARRVTVAFLPRLTSLRPRITRLALDSVSVRLRSASGEEPEAFATPEEPKGGPVSPRVRAAAAQLAEAMLVPARRLPEVRLTDLEISRGDSLLGKLDAL